MKTITIPAPPGHHAMYPVRESARESLHIIKNTEILPPTEEEIAALNELARKPPFCHTQRRPKYDPR